MEVDLEECHRGISTDREERDTDVRRQIVEPWAWQRHGTTEVGLPWSHRSLALIKGERLVMNEAEKVENVEANSKYQDKAEGQRPRNFIRPVSMSFSSRLPKVKDFGSYKSA